MPVPVIQDPPWDCLKAWNHILSAPHSHLYSPCGTCTVAHIGANSRVEWSAHKIPNLIPRVLVWVGLTLVKVHCSANFFFFVSLRVTNSPECSKIVGPSTPSWHIRDFVERSLMQANVILSRQTART